MKDAAKYFYSFPAVRFLVVGGANFVLTYSVYLVALTFTGYRAAYWIALVAGLLFTALLNIRHTFGHRVNFVSVAGYGAYYYCYSLLHVTLITILIQDYGVKEVLAPLVTLTALTPPHFIVSRLLIQRLARQHGPPNPF